MCRRWNKLRSLMSLVIATVVILLIMCIPVVDAAPAVSPIQEQVGTAFTYQGYLEDGGVPADGIYDLRFSLWDDPGIGAQFGPYLEFPGTTIVEGMFTVLLDFGDVFDGTALWLQIEVKDPAEIPYTVLIPRQALTPTPFALHADKLDGLQASDFALGNHDHYAAEWSGSSALPGLSVDNGATDGVGVYGLASAVTGEGVGVHGESYSPDGVGVSATVNNGGTAVKAYVGPGPDGVGVSSKVDAEGGTAVFGWSNAETGFDAIGVGGQADGPSSRGVYGIATDDGLETSYGVMGVAHGENSYGGYFNNSHSDGMLLAAGGASWTDPDFKVDYDGDVYADGTFYGAALDVKGYIRMGTISGSGPPAADCDETDEAGRMIIRTDGSINLYICTGTTGWVGK